MSVGTRPSDGTGAGDEQTVAAVDDIDGRPHLVVADVTREDAWVAVTEPAAVSLDEWE